MKAMLRYTETERERERQRGEERKRIANARFFCGFRGLGRQLLSKEGWACGKVLEAS